MTLMLMLLMLMLMLLMLMLLMLMLLMLAICLLMERVAATSVQVLTDRQAHILRGPQLFSFLVATIFSSTFSYKP